MDLFATISALIGLLLAVIRYEYDLVFYESSITEFLDKDNENYFNYNAGWTRRMNNPLS